MRILVLEDDARITAPLVDDLRRQRHMVDAEFDGHRGLSLAESGVYDVILLDIMLPGMDGLSVCKRVREVDDKSLILMITARDAVADKLAAFDAGADDYVVKPFDLAELSARIRAVGRRGREFRSAALKRGDLILDPQRARVTYAQRPVALTPTEYSILETLMRNPLQVFTASMLQEKASSVRETRAVESIKSHVKNLRKKLREVGCVSDPIVTVYGMGYRLADP